VAWLPRAFVAVVIVVVAAAMAAAVKDIIANALSGLSYGRLLANIASVFILGLGVIAALNQIGVATTVTTPILIAVLATIAGILIVGVGGGLVRPMQHRWEAWLERASRETQAIAEQARAYQEGQRATREALAAQTATQSAAVPAAVPADPAAVPGGFGQSDPAYAGTTATQDPAYADPRTGQAPAYSTGAAPVYREEDPTEVIPPATNRDPYNQQR
jgi:hypothetical protein